MKTILVVDDEPDIVDIVRYNLEHANFIVVTAADGESALKEAERLLPDVIILDLLLPGIDGIEVCRFLKQGETTRAIPIMMLTAKGEEIDRIVGLELGADDYIVKPFSPRELVLRVKAILRRSTHQKEDAALLRIGPLTVDVEGYRVEVNDQPIALTATELKLLLTLIERRGRIQTRDHLLSAVWGYDYAGYARTVDTHIKRLREKLGPAREWIETVRGIGYRFKREGGNQPGGKDP
jgi:two-component system phosphate regulon response regulator PhoB